MKKLFTLIGLALVAIGVNAQSLPENWYPIKDITWKAITWKNGNNKTDKDNNPMYFLMGTGNGYENIYCEYFYSEDKGEYISRAEYTYTDYTNGDKGTPKYGLYYKFTPKKAGLLKINVWVNKGGDNRKTFVVKESDGQPLVPFVDYKFEGYINGQNVATDQPKINAETGEQEIDNDGNPVYIVAPKFFTEDEFKAKHDEAFVTDGVDAQPYKISFNNQAVWGYITFNVSANESYYIFQQSSQLGFGGYEFEGESYVASPGGGLAEEFAAVVDADGNATNVDDRGSVVTFGTANMACEAVGGAEPEEVTPDTGTGISSVKNGETSNASMFNLAGQRVNESYKGVVIQNGKKLLNK